MSDAVCELITAALDGGSLRIFDAKGTRLAELRFQSPAFKSVWQGGAEANLLVFDPDIRATGKAVSYACYKRDGKTEVLSGAIVSDGAKQDNALELRSLDLQQHAELHITSFRVKVS